MTAYKAKLPLYEFNMIFYDHNPQENSQTLQSTS